MLIRLVPVPPSPTVLFTLTYPGLPENIPMPPNWHGQLQRLLQDDLEMPTTIYALDKASWIVAVLHEVIFDMNNRTVTCVFLDGLVEEWPMSGNECTQALERVLADVNESALENEREKERERRASVPPSPSPSSVSLPASSSSAPPPKHKKQRSLLMSLVASLVPHHSSSKSSASTSASASTVAESNSIISQRASTPLSPPPVPSMTGKLLRRRARSTLVDTFRRFVLCELRPRVVVASGGYYAWIAHSSLRRATKHMEHLVREAGGCVPEEQLLQFRQDQDATEANRGPFFENEDGQSSVETETDGSSVHTPTDHAPITSTMFDPKFNSGFSSSHSKTLSSGSFPRSPSPLMFSPEDLATYTALSGQCLRLRQLLSRLETNRESATNEERHVHSVLEIKSRRRAFSNRRLASGAMLGNLGLGTPFRSSPLARCEPITTEDFLEEDEEVEESGGDWDGLETRSKESDECLFPVMEDDDDEFYGRGEDENARAEVENEFAQLGFVRAAECAGLDVDPDVDSFERPFVRQRTKSIPPAAAPSRFSPTSLLCQPLRHQEQTPSNGGTVSVRPPLVRGRCFSDGSTELKSKQLEANDPEMGTPSEFTLAMDLPPVFGPRGRGKKVYDPDDWPGMQMPMPPVIVAGRGRGGVECR